MVAKQNQVHDDSRLHCWEQTTEQKWSYQKIVPVQYLKAKQLFAAL